MSAQKRKLSPQKRQNVESEENESFQRKLTTEEKECAKEIVKNVMKANRTECYAERARRREHQEEITTELAAEEKEDTVAETNLENLSEVIQESVEAFHDIEISADGKELYRDAKVLQSLSSVLLKKTSVVQGMSKRHFSAASFFRRLKIYTTEQLEKEKEEEERYADEANPALVLDESDTLLQSDDEDSESGTQPDFNGLNRPQWALLGRRMGGILHKPPQLTCLNPLFDVEKDADAVEKREARKPRAKDEKTEQLTLKNKEQGEHAQDEMAVSKELNNVRKALRRAFKRSNGQVEYYRFVIDPTDFGKSVENMFHVSFLVKDGMARLDMDDETELPTLYELSNEQRELMKQGEADGEETSQAILPFSMKIWRDMIDAMDLTDSMIPSSTTTE